MVNKIKIKKYLSYLFIIFCLNLILQGDEIKFDFNKYYNIYGEKINIKKSNTLVIYINPKYLIHRGALYYAKIINRKYSDNNDLQIIGVSGANFDENDLKKIIEEYKIKYDIIIDKKNDIANYFGICADCGNILLLKNKRVVQLISHINSNDDIREIVEWEMFKKVKEQSKPIYEQKLSKGEKIEWLNVRTISSRKFFHLINKINQISVITFFSSMCGFCKTGKRLTTLNIIKQRLPDINIISLLLPPLIKKDIFLFKNKGFEFPGIIYFSKNFFSIDELYLTNPNYKKDPFTIVVDKDGKIIYSEDSGISEKILIERVINIFKEKKK